MQLNKLGKRAPRIDPRTFQFKKYRTKEALKLPAPPSEVSWVTKVPAPWNVFLNNEIGDCTVAAVAHMIMQWSFYAGKPIIPTDNQVLVAYEEVGGYIPGQPDTDNGADMLTVLNTWRKSGLCGQKILGYVAIDPSNLTEIREAIQLFGNVYTGIALPVTAQGQSAWTVANGGVYTPDGAQGSWGGHAIPLVASSPITHTCITWGDKLKMSHNFGSDYIDEMYAVVSPLWLEANGMSPSGFNLAQLQEDLAAL